MNEICDRCGSTFPRAVQRARLVTPHDAELRQLALGGLIEGQLQEPFRFLIC